MPAARRDANKLFYENPVKDKKGRAVIAAVRPGSIAAAMGVSPGDTLVAINGKPVADIIVYHYLCAAENLEIEIVKPDGERWLLEIEKDYDDDIGLELAQPTADGIRRCSNKCLFCFVDQMPARMRPALYIKDDDYRFSFLHGNFITLTNLKKKDWEYIRRWHLSPLYISVHTTNPELRQRMLGHPRAGAIREQLQELAAAGIRFHTQIVLCPGLNDGAELERTINDLADLVPAVQSIGIVPVGLTSNRALLFPLRRVTPGEAAAIVARVAVWQDVFRRRFGCGLVYGADELYLLAGRPVPPAAYYDDFPQTENGIGLARLFLDEFNTAVKNLQGRHLTGRRVAIATGLLAAPLLAGAVARATAMVRGLEARVIPVVNNCFGAAVTVAGLLTGRDLIGGLKETVPWLRKQDGFIIIPAVMIKKDTSVFLDDLTPDMVAETLGVPVRVVPATGRGLVDGIGYAGDFCRSRKA